MEILPDYTTSLLAASAMEQTIHELKSKLKRQKSKKINRCEIKYEANITPYHSKPIKNGAGKKKLSRKQRKQK
ncbi:hypothetical protein DXA95_04675 [Odoribacter sp. OF09-27XD]|jgi:hypothetical protein|nr:hypothetical protein [Odoribacter sp. OF09-27XD]RHV96970.1 hypothetical protein DXA95_04675 [Odoribacter sp. OF09-27XD]